MSMARSPWPYQVLKTIFLETVGMMVLLRDWPPPLTTRLGDGLRQALVELIVGDGKCSDHNRRNFGLDGNHPGIVERATAVLVGDPDVSRPPLGVAVHLRGAVRTKTALCVPVGVALIGG